MSLPATKVLYVITDLRIGGVPLHLYRLTRAMRARGFDPSVVSLAPLGPIANNLRDDGFRVQSCEGFGPWDIHVFGRLARIFEQEKPDIVHAFLFHANVASRRAAQLCQFPRNHVLCEVQTVEVERRWHLWVDRLTHRGCRFTIGNSPSVIDHLHTQAGIPRERLRLVRGGVHPAKYVGVVPFDRSTLKIPDGVPLIVWVGRLDPVKGLDTLLASFEMLVDRTDAHLLLVGDGPDDGRIKALAGNTQCAKRIHMLGPRRDVASILASADMFAFPSRTEGLPNALLEAMATGCPIVTTDAPGCRDLIEHKRNGLLVPFGDTDKLSTTIFRLLADRDLATRLGRQAQVDVADHWHLRKTFKAYAALYSEVLA